MPDLIPQGDRFLGLLRAHMQTSVGGFYSQPTNRLLIYFVLGGIFILEGLLALAFYKGPSLLISHMAFTTVYALHTALTYTGCQLAVDILACRLLPDWGCYPKRTVGRQWLVWSAGFMLAFIVHRTVVLCLVHFYAPEVVAYYADPQHTRPSATVAFFYTLPYWSAGVFLAVSIIVHVQKKLFSKASCDALKRKEACGSLKVSTDSRIFQIPHLLIVHITVEDHYSRIYYLKNNVLQNVLIRMPLRALQQSLPTDHFFQIHRCHLVNLRHVYGLSKNRRELKMKWAQNGGKLPVSRNRLPDLRRRLMNYRWPPDFSGAPEP